MALFHPEYGVPFTMTGPAPQFVLPPTAVFNDPTSPNYVGMITNIDGLDSAEVRESGDVLVAADGGVQGPNFYGRRPIVIEGLIEGKTYSSGDRGTRIDRLIRASNSMRSDSVLTWTPSGAGTEPVFLTLRRQQPLRVQGGWNKTFQLSMVAADPRIYTVDTRYAASSSSVFGAPLTPLGTADPMYPTVYVFGPMPGPTINLSNGVNEGIDITVATSLGVGEALAIDIGKRTVVKHERRFFFNYFPNPSFEGTVAPLTASTGTTFTNHVAQPSGHSSGYGAFVGQYTAAGGFTAVKGVTGTLLPTKNGFLTGDAVVVQWSAMSPAMSGTRQMAVEFTWFNGSNAQIGSVVEVTGSNLTSANTWIRGSFQAFAPAGADHCTIALKVKAATGNIPSGEIFYLDAVTITGQESYDYWRPTQDYFDGSTAPQLGMTYPWFTGWTGTTNNSISVAAEAAINPLGDSTTDLYAAVDLGGSSWGGVSPNDLNTQRFYVLGMSSTNYGAGIALAWRDAWL